MKKDFLHEEIDKKVDMNFSFDEIKHKVSCDKYKKQGKYKKPLFIFGGSVTAVAALTVAIVVTIISGESQVCSTSACVNNSNIANNTTSINPPSNSGEVVTPDEVTGFKYHPYDGPFIQNLKGMNMNTNDASGPSYLWSIEDAFDPDSEYYELCEVTNSFETSQTIGAYMKSSTAKRIYDNYKEVTDVECASPLNVVDGSIVKWFYNGNQKYSDNDIKWVEYDDNCIPLFVDGYRLVGFYTLGTSTIKSVIKSDSRIDKTYNYYQTRHTIIEESNFKDGMGIFYQDISVQGSTWYFVDTRSNLEVSFFDRLYISNSVAKVVEDKIKVLYLGTTENELYNAFLNEIDQYFIEKDEFDSWRTYSYTSFVAVLNEVL